MIAHSLLHLLKQNKVGLLCCGLSSKDILLLLLEKVIYGGLSRALSVVGLRSPVLSVKHSLTFHLSGTQLTVDQRNLCKEVTFLKPVKIRTNIALLYKVISKLALPTVSVGIQGWYKFSRARFAGVVNPRGSCT